jgi:cytochrome P450 family 110
MKLPNTSKTPAFIQMMQWIAFPLSMMEDCAKRYGDIFTLSVSPKLTPIVFFPRVVETPVRLCGWDLEPGTLLYGNIYLTHQREDLYPDPKKFDPERFLEKQFSPYEYLPFGGGVRRCIGAAFALFEMKIALVKILSEYSLALTDNSEVKPKRRGLVTAPASPIKMVVTGKRVSSITQSDTSAKEASIAT